MNRKQQHSFEIKCNIRRKRKQTTKKQCLFRTSLILLTQNVNLFCKDFGWSTCSVLVLVHYHVHYHRHMHRHKKVRRVEMIICPALKVTVCTFWSVGQNNFRTFGQTVTKHDQTVTVDLMGFWCKHLWILIWFDLKEQETPVKITPHRCSFQTTAK